LSEGVELPFCSWFRFVGCGPDKTPQVFIYDDAIKYIEVFIYDAKHLEIISDLHPASYNYNYQSKIDLISK